MYIKFLCFFLLSVFLFADSIDNEMLESLRQSKEESMKEKQKKENDNKELDNKIIKKTHDRSPFRSINKESDDSYEYEEKYQKITWFVGGSSSFYLDSKYANKEVNFINLALNVGLLYNFNEANGLRFFTLGVYNMIDSKDYFSLGGGIDYVYNFKNTKLSLFGGILSDMPLLTLLLKQPNILLSVGLAGYLDKNISLEMRIGYLVFKDVNFNSILSLGVGINFLFNTK